MDNLEARVIRHEGKKKSAYQDSLGYWTIGIGRLIDSRKNAGLSDDEMLYLLRNDLAESEKELMRFPWFTKMDRVRQEVMIELHFNIGLANLLGFKNMIAYLTKGSYINAATQLLNSLWAKQVGENRSSDMANRLRTGSY